MRAIHSGGVLPPDDRTLDIYFRSIRRYRQLNRREETDLARQVKRGDKEALDRLVTANLRFVVKVAKRYVGRGMALSDLIAEGNTGLIEAVRRFDENKGYRFITYAVHWIRQAILKSLAKQSRIVRPPMNQIDDLEKIERRSRDLSQTLGRNPTFEEVAESTKMSFNRARRALNVGKSDVSLDALLGPDFEDTEPSITLDIPPAYEHVEMEDLSETVRNCLTLLDEREADIVRLRFGLDGQEPMTLSQVGARMRITRERVRQLQQRAIEKMKRTCSEQLLPYLPAKPSEDN